MRTRRNRGSLRNTRASERRHAAGPPQAEHAETSPPAVDGSTDPRLLDGTHDAARGGIGGADPNGLWPDLPKRSDLRMILQAIKGEWGPPAAAKARAMEAVNRVLHHPRTTTGRLLVCVEICAAIQEYGLRDQVETAIDARALMDNPPGSRKSDE